MQRRRTNMLRSATGGFRRREGSFSEDEEFDEGSYKEDNRQLAQEQALGEGQTRGHGGVIARDLTTKKIHYRSNAALVEVCGESEKKRFRP